MGNCCRSFQKSTPSIKNHRRRHVSSAITPDEGLGHSFCYNKNFISISGASVSANTSTALSTTLDFETLNSYSVPAAFESSNRFASIPLQPIPRFLSGPIDRGFLSGPIERGFLSGPIENGSDMFSSPFDRTSISKNGLKLKSRISKAIAKAVRGTKVQNDLNFAETSSSSGFISIDGVTNNNKDENLQWAQGKAGEDRVHVVISEDKNWVFVGIYDGFNGPDATDYLLSNFYLQLQKELENLDFGDSKQVLKALNNSLMKTEETFLDCADMMVSENPELALMGSCVLVMLMIGEDLYLMNVGDSRAVLASKGPEKVDDELLNLNASQLTLDHSTNVEEEVVRIRNEHQDDNMAIVNDRVKGSLKVTRAFGAGFLKQPKWNNALLEMFQIDYIGTSPYITCNPFLYHHKIGAEDKFLILSSDGLYQYFTNEEAVAEVELFISTTPEGDPAQHLLEELLFRAAKTAGMDFHELLEIPQGDRRRYHDDVSVIVMSLEGRIWKSSV